jgi:hypothetical protein
MGGERTLYYIIMSRAFMLNIRNPYRIREFFVAAAAVLASVAAPAALFAQEGGGDEYVIEDNSFLIEEAYNQEPGIIQHISNLVHVSPWSAGEFAYSLTEEWPVGGRAHQAGFTLPYYRQGGPGGNGAGDILLNYRYQLSSEGVAVAPRLSVILPTGDEARGLGSGVVGIQANLPVSRRLGRAFVGHLNAGITVLPGVESADAAGGKASHTLTAYSAGGSVIWLASRRLNLHLEGLFSDEGEPGPSGGVDRTSEFILNPAARYAADFGSLQVVPGFGVPVLFTGGARPRASFFFYLSFEHPL